jgi:hypothetical protein
MKISDIKELGGGRFSLDHMGEVFKDFFDESDLSKLFNKSSRSSEYVVRRRLFAGLAVEYKFKQDDVADFLGYADHSTISHLCYGSNKGVAGHIDMIRSWRGYGDYGDMYRALKEQCETVMKFCIGPNDYTCPEVMDWGKRSKPHPAIFVGAMDAANKSRRFVAKPGLLT